MINSYAPKRQLAVKPFRVLQMFETDKKSLQKQVLIC
jgi:hypothetical protein